MIYRNALDIPEAEGTIYEEKNYWYFHAVSNAPEKKWEKPVTMDDIENNMIAEGWKIIKSRKNPCGMMVINVEHIETAEYIAKKKKATEEKYAGAEKGFVHFGNIPKSGKSHNYRDDVDEAGLSCFAAEFAKDGSWRVIADTKLTVTLANVADRKAYRVWGEVVGTGADGEPLILVEKSRKLK